jgi:hypothetical protein
MIRQRDFTGVGKISYIYTLRTMTQDIDANRRRRPVFSEAAIEAVAAVIESSIYFRSQMASKREALQLALEVLEAFLQSQEKAQ